MIRNVFLRYPEVMLEVIALKVSTLNLILSNK